MYKALIVDDELLIRIGVKSCIKWNDFGFEEAQTVETGHQALKIIAEDGVDLLITDIMMPKMNGIELIEKALAINKNIKIICLSCHNDYEYVRTALKLGAKDYILKLSMKSEELGNLINEIKEELGTSNYIMPEIKESLEIFFEDNLRKYINKIIDEKMFLKNIENKKFILNSEYSLVYLQVDKYYIVKEKGKIKEKNLFKFSFNNLMLELLFEYNVFLSEINEGRYILFFYALEKSIDFNILFEKINLSLHRYLNITCTFFVYGIFDKLESIDKLYYGLSNFSQINFYGNSYIYYFENKIFKKDGIYLDNKLESNIIISFKQLDYIALELHINKMFDELVEKAEYNPFKVKMMFMATAHCIIKESKIYELEMDKLLDKQKYPYENIINYEKIFEVKESILEISKILIEEIKKLNLPREHSEIIKAKTYILNNIEKEITLKEISKYCNISKSYFSTLFKKETGENFNDYTNRIKMEKAYDLISIYGLKAYQAAEKVGIYDNSYFTKIFKKYMKINPSDVNCIL